MKRITTRVGNNDLVSTLRQRRGQVAVKNTQREPETPKKRNYSGGSQYEQFLRKYENLEEYIDSFKTRDLTYYFKKVAEEAGFKYVISNVQKDMHIFKVLLQNYSPREICGMIEFLYNSEQDYLDRERLSPNILASSWINTVYADFKLWVEDKYIPRSKKRTSKKLKGEWESSDTVETQIGAKF
jgi:hypothetical protein